MTLFASLSPASASRVSTVLNKPLLASPVTHLLGPRWTWPMLWARVPCVFGSVVWTYKRLPTIERIETSPTPFSMSRKAELSHNRLTTSAHNQPVSATATTNDDIFSIRSSNPRGAANYSSIEHTRPPQYPASPAGHPTLPPPSAPEEADVDNALHLLSLNFQSFDSTPTPSTPTSSLGNLDTFIHTLNQELRHSPNASIICSVKQNNEPGNIHDAPLEQRPEKRMNVQLSAIPPAANQRIKLPVPPATFASGASEPKPLFLSLIIAGETTRRIFGGVGLYHPNQPKSELLHIIEGSNFSPVVGIMSGRTVCIGFRFTTYPRQCDPSEEAFRVVATIHNSDGRLVAYCLSASAYAIKSHLRNTKPPQSSTYSRVNRRWDNSALDAMSFTSTTRDHALPSSSSTTGSSAPQHSGEFASTGGPPAVEHAVDRLGVRLRPMVDPRLQSLPYSPYPFRQNPTEGPQPMPTLYEVVPASHSRRGGIVSLFVSNLPPDGPIYARFKDIVVKTDRKTPHVLTCRVPSARGPCEVDVTLSKGSRPFDPPYGLSICKFTYEDDTAPTFQTSPDRALLQHNPYPYGC